MMKTLIAIFVLSVLVIAPLKASAVDVCVSVPLNKAQVVIDAFVNTYPKGNFQGTDRAWVKKKMRDYVREVTIQYWSNKASTAARSTAKTQAEGDTAGIN